MTRQERADKIAGILDRLFPQPAIPLIHDNAFQLLVATVLAADTPSPTSAAVPRWNCSGPGTACANYPSAPSTSPDASTSRCFRCRSLQAPMNGAAMPDNANAA